MKYLKLILFFFCIQLSLAQTDLFVSNNSNSYIFVSDRVLYVEDGIELNGANSNLYLRNEAQLVQGDETVFNSGIGKLSTYQNGTVHNFAYNYWASPVGNILANNSINRSFRADNNIYDVTTAPITSSLATFTSGNDGTTSPLVISNRWIYTYNPGTQYSDWDYVAENGTVTTGYGFTMKGTSGSSNNQLYDFRGKPNTGTIAVAVAAPVAGDPQWTLTGNPYPSALDARDYIHDAQNVNAITGTLYYWEQDLSVNSHYVADYVGGYATYTINAAGTIETWVAATFDTYNADGSLNTTGSSSTSGKRAFRYIPIAQGFMVEGRVGTTGTVYTRNSHRDYVKQSAANSEFFLPNGTNSENRSNNSDYTIAYDDDSGYSYVPDEVMRFRLNVDINETYTRQLVQTFTPEATADEDYGLDSKSPEGVASDAHWIINENSYVAQALQFDETLTIPLNVNLAEAMPVRFRILDIQNFDEAQSIYLHDKENELYVDLRSQNYDLNLEVGLYENRFEITFLEQDTLGEDDITITDFDVFQNNNTSQLTIKNPNHLDVKNVSLFDVSGKQIFTKTNLQIENEYRFSTKNLSDGVYITTITMNGSNQVKKKVIIKNN